ncbi:MULTISPECIES: hypothetical protein [unclassified Bradyrhizobium]|uniref:hypothetical protein n=1 Tax=unclassified Bradyrhizobium TaxID=2631580 RepID=UPI0024E05AC5|nr:MULTISPECIES: hypothetical protein [unclassified Bradyrhizobium]
MAALLPQHAFGRADERQCVDVKSQRPDTPTLVSSRVAPMCRVAMVANKPGAPGRLRISVKTIAQGMPACSALPVVTAACFSCCRRAMGEAFTRHSLRPLHFQRDELIAKLGLHRPRDRVLMSKRCLNRESDPTNAVVPGKP